LFWRHYWFTRQQHGLKLEKDIGALNPMKVFDFDQAHQRSSVSFYDAFIHFVENTHTHTHTHQIICVHIYIQIVHQMTQFHLYHLTNFLIEVKED